MSRDSKGQQETVEGNCFARKFLNRGQQEMVGFVLIVVLVIIGLMVFLVISVTGEPDPSESLEVGDLLDAVLKHTTKCAIVFEPQYDDFEDLFKSCYEGKRCSNLGKDACEYLNESLRAVLDDSMSSLANVNYYRLEFTARDNEGQSGVIPVIEEGTCTGTSLSGASRLFSSDLDRLFVSLELCRDE